MYVNDAEDLSKFPEELKKETDRGLPLVGTVLIDEKLRDTLDAFFIGGKINSKLLNDSNSPLGTFSSRIDICYGLGLIDEFEYKEINYLRKIRNEFAHAKHGISFKTGKIKDLCSNLKTITPEIEGFDIRDPKTIFIFSITNIVLRLYYRPVLIKSQKRNSNSFGENNGTLIPHPDISNKSSI